jgi:phosphoribosylanthranilate isomerase
MTERKTKIKICGITNIGDARLSAELGAFALGFNFYKKSPRYVTPDAAYRICEELSAGVLKVGVFVNENLNEILEIAKAVRLDAVQLHGEESPEFSADLKRSSDLLIIKAFRVSPDFVAEQVLGYDVDLILLDAFSKNAHGGTGHTFDWRIAKSVSAVFPKMFLAGGMSAANIADAINTVAPYGIDACSGLESRPSVKDVGKLREFFAKANGSL